mmetsp:Transcript_17888/g.49612  ORF Transcript_17888/g.49612 Transcript_17888/m.49612 type:complete len:88 (-) Transcript_17888:658-921(-)
MLIASLKSVLDPHAHHVIQVARLQALAARCCELGADASHASSMTARARSRFPKRAATFPSTQHFAQQEHATAERLFPSSPQSASILV